MGGQPEAALNLAPRTVLLTLFYFGETFRTHASTVLRRNLHWLIGFDTVASELNESVLIPVALSSSRVFDLHRIDLLCHADHFPKPADRK
jgi:hypothetical protein